MPTQPEDEARPNDESSRPSPEAATRFQPRPGDYHLMQKRSWRTWQVFVAVLVAVVLGMWLNSRSGPPVASSANPGGSDYALPPQSSSGSTTTAPGATGADGSTVSGTGSTPTTAAGTTTKAKANGTATTATTATTTVTPDTGPETILVPATQMRGNWTSNPFTVTNPPWQIGWAYQCSPAPASGPSFEVFVTPSGGKEDPTPVVSESGTSGQQITNATSTGTLTVSVVAASTCEWAVKIVGH